MKSIADKYGRVHDYLRISLTDRCNLNCVYCYPSFAGIKLTDKSDLLSFEEILRLVKIFAGELGFKKIRFTGGEPLVRKNVMDLFSMIKNLKQLYSFKTAITTNGTLLNDKIYDLKKYGIDKINISLDSLKEDNFKSITGRDNFYDVISAIFNAKKAGYDNLKINCVVMKGINDCEILDFADFAVKENLNIRFIEYMPFSNNGWNDKEFFSYKEIFNKISEKYELIPAFSNGSVSKDFKIKNNNGVISFISSISDNFCSTCSRLRITAKGNLRLCLFSPQSNELNLQSLLNNSSISDSDIADIIKDYLLLKPKEHPVTEELVKLDLNYMLTNGG